MRLVNLENDGGMGPFSSLCDISRMIKLVIFVMDNGIVPPVSWFWSNHKLVNFVNLEMLEDGILPVSEFSVNDRTTRSVKRDI